MENKPINELNEVYDYLSSDDELYHHGILGMKWGVRRFQPYSLIPRRSGKGGKETGAAKKSKSSKSSVKKGSSVKKAVIKKKSRKQTQEEVKAKKLRDLQTARQRNEEKQKILKSGDAKLIYENRENFTRSQMDEAINRINTEAALRSLVAQQNPSKSKKLKSTVNKLVNPNSLQKTADMIEKGINVYNQGARIANLMRDSEHQLKYIGKAENKDRNDIITSAARKIINTGDPVAILQNQGRMSDAEIKAAKDRLDNLAKIRSQEKGIEKHYKEMETLKRDVAKQKRQYREEDLDYLRKSIKESEDAVKKDAGTFKVSPVEPTVRDNRSVKDIMAEDANRFSYIQSTPQSDEYFENEWRKRNHSD